MVYVAESPLSRGGLWRSGGRAAWEPQPEQLRSFGGDTSETQGRTSFGDGHLRHAKQRPQRWHGPCTQLGATIPCAGENVLFNVYTVKCTRPS